jgi:hypothetical protein
MGPRAAHYRKLVGLTRFVTGGTDPCLGDEEFLSSHLAGSRFIDAEARGVRGIVLKRGSAPRMLPPEGTGESCDLDSSEGVLSVVHPQGAAHGVEGVGNSLHSSAS